MEIFLRNIKKSFNGKVVFSDINFSFKKGEIFYICGENGSGKTTLLNIISFLVKPDYGEILYRAEDKIFEYRFPYLPEKTVLSKISYLPQKNIILKGNVEYNIKIGKILRKDKNFDEKFYNLVEMFGFFDILKKDIYEISEGKKKVACFLRTVIVDWEILLLDEPFSNLDSRYIDIIYEYLFEEKNKGKTIIITKPESHDIRICKIDY
ncbi:MAG: ATP-binding cassette domain-containing protein [Candidatus Ratteibacteria bacterium]